MVHGQYKTRLYRTWDGMLTRCYNPFHESWEFYGKKGVRVCDEWHKFKPFYEWAIVNGYDDSLFIDRKESDKNYTPDNCRFVTRLENNNNSRQNVKITIFGETKNISEWTRDVRCAVSPRLFRSRLREQGWAAESALTKAKQ